MPRIVYLCPDTNTPTGGIKVIYRHVEALAAMGCDAHVMHIGEGFRCDWFPNKAPVLHLAEMLTSDIVVVPEVMAQLTPQLIERKMTYVMFVQNGYLLLPSADIETLRACYRNAALVLSISDDTSNLVLSLFPELVGRVLRQTYTVDRAKFFPAAKQKIVTYMPRKLPLHSANVVPWLTAEFPDWKFVPLHGLGEDMVAMAMRVSRVFLAFSDFEGCPVPPIEAALSGNIVLGYPGWGGREYWEEPNFRDVDVGDIRGFVRQFHEIDALLRKPQIDALLAPGIAKLAARYDPSTEVGWLRRLGEYFSLLPGQVAQTLAA